MDSIGIGGALGEKVADKASTVINAHQQDKISTIIGDVVKSGQCGRELMIPRELRSVEYSCCGGGGASEGVSP